MNDVRGVNDGATAQLASAQVVWLDRAGKLRLALDVWNSVWSAIVSLALVAAVLWLLFLAAAVGLLIYLFAAGPEAESTGPGLGLGLAIIGIVILPTLGAMALIFAWSRLHRAVNAILLGACVTALAGYFAYGGWEIFRADWLTSSEVRDSAWRLVQPESALNPLRALDARHGAFRGICAVLLSLILLSSRHLAWDAAWLATRLLGLGLTILAAVDAYRLLPTFAAAPAIGVAFALIVMLLLASNWEAWTAPRFLWWVGLAASGALLVWTLPAAASRYATLWPIDLRPVWSPAAASASPFIGLLMLAGCGTAALYGGQHALDDSVSVARRALCAVVASAGVIWIIAAMMAEPPSWWWLTVREVIGGAKAVVIGVARDTWHGAGLLWAAFWDALVDAWRAAFGLIGSLYMTFTVVLMVAIACYLFELPDTLLRKPADVAIARYPVPRERGPRLRYVMGLSPAGYLARSSRASIAALLVGKLVYGICVSLALLTALAGSLLLGNVAGGWLSGAPVASQATSDGMLMIGAAVLATAIILAMSLGLRRLSQKYWPKLYDEVRGHDPRAPLLFLRSYKDDRGAIGFVTLLPIDGAASIDELLLSLGGAYGPVIAVGRPQESDAPFGASRLYMRDDAWQDEVRALIGAAQLVFVSVDATPGVEWEIDHILKSGLQERTIFLFARRLRRGEVDELVPSLMRRLGLAPLSQAQMRSVLGVYMHDGKGLALLAGNKAGPTYYAAIMHALLTKFGYPEGTLARPVFPAP